jgi:hypothetical protein
MAKFNVFSRMPKADHSQSNKIDKKKRRKNHATGGNGGYDSDDSVDSNGNLRDLINYEYTSEDEDTTPISLPIQTKRPVRKAAIIARNKINKIVKNSTMKDNLSSKNEIHYPNVKRKDLSPLKPPHALSYFPKKEEHVKEERIKEESSASDDEDDSDYEDTENDSDDDSEDDSEDDYSDDDDSEDGYSDDDSEDDYSDDLEDSEDSEDDNDDMEDDEEEYYDDEYDEKENGKEFGKILLTLAGANFSNSMIPKKYKIKQEPEIVKKFVKLLTSPVEENTIDTQIDQFKKLTDDKQNELVCALENRPIVDSGVNLMLKILTLKLSPDIQAMVLSKYNSLQSLDTSSNEYFKLRAWLDKLISVPFGMYKDIPVRLDDGPEKCSEFMRNARKWLDRATYGQEDPKLQIMQFISTKIANPAGKGLSLLLIGPPGIGKTTIIKNGIANALGWPFQFISLGGDSDASTYTGHQLVYESSHCGKIVNSLVASKSMSAVLMFDEVDKISQTPKGEEIMNLLIHLTDPVQNSEFEDKYLSGIPIDLSKVMFVFSANDITKIDKVLLDRMIVIDLKGYDLKEKTIIAEQYLLPESLKEVNLTEKIGISKEILTTIIQEYASEEKGVRELKRCIDQIAQKINMLRMYNSPELPFYIKDFSLPFIVKKEHIKLFLKKKENTDAAPYGMYV